MSDNRPICKAWLKRGCPFSFKFLLFMTEIGLADRVDIVEMVEGAGDYDQIKGDLSDRLGKSATFPTVEVAPGEFMSDSDELIKFYADKHGVDVDSLVTLPFYLRGVFANLRKYRQTAMAYKEKYGELTG